MGAQPEVAIYTLLHRFFEIWVFAVSLFFGATAVRSGKRSHTARPGEKKPHRPAQCAALLSAQALLCAPHQYSCETLVHYQSEHNALCPVDHHQPSGTAPHDAGPPHGLRIFQAVEVPCSRCGFQARLSPAGHFD